jgi:hypothetical protein
MQFAHLLAILGACMAKLASSADDVVWLLPFVSVNGRLGRWKSIALYICTLEAVVALSWIIAVFGSQTMRAALPAHDAQRVLALTGAALLCAYAAWLFARESKGGGGGPRGSSLVVIAFLGSLDELASFPALQWGGLFSAWQLAAGTALAGIAVAAVCLGAARLKPLVRSVERIPLWGIIGTFALLSLAQALR